MNAKRLAFAARPCYVRPVLRRLLTVAAVLGVLLAVPASAGAVLSGTNGRIVYISGSAFGNTQLFLRTVTSSTGGGFSTTGPIATAPTQQRRHPTWSPDRTKIAFAQGSSAGPGPFDIYIYDLTAPAGLQNPQNITNTPGVSEDRPAWSPDGTRIAYETGVTSDIIVHPLSGGLDLNLTTGQARKAWKAAWSPDSQTLYYSVGDIAIPPNGTTNDVVLWRQPADNSTAGAELLHASGAHVFQPSISPDGTKMCFTFSTAINNSITARIFVVPVSAPGSPPLFLTNSGVGDYNCTWSPDGTKIAYTEDFGANGEVFMEESDGSSVLPINLTNAAGLFDGNPDWAPDGRPVCPDSTVTTPRNTPVTFQVDCTDTGPAYEQSNVRESKLTDPAHGTLTQASAGDPFTYTPNQGFTGKDSFVVRSFDEFGFSGDTGTVTIDVQPAQTGGPGPGGTPVRCGGKTATIVGTTGNDVLTGTRKRDVIAGLAGNDRIRGGGGRDLICGGRGRDRISGGRGNDRIGGGSGNDVIGGNGGSDLLSGNSRNDLLNGGSGQDTLRGGTGRDTLKGGLGVDRLNGGRARDVCRGGPGVDSASRCEIRVGIP
jgi:dipeptidyl aminopeptidase/acylaminoacyl peptidase